MNKIKIIIIFVIIIIILLLLVLGMYILIPKEEKTDTQGNAIENSISNTVIEEENQENIPPSFSEDPGYIGFYTVSNCISSYTEKTEGNIFIPVTIVRAETGVVQAYKVYGIIANASLEYRDDAYFIVYLDTTNKTYLVEKQSLQYSDINQIQVAQLDTIELTNDNTFVYQELSQEYKYKQLFNQMKRLMLAKPEIAYDYLEENYKSKRFENYEYFKNFIDNNRDRLVDVFPQKYKVDDDPNDILLIDQYGNWYEFIVTGTMKYTAKIDNNIVLLSRDIQKYKTYSEEEKIKFNIARWIEMLNTRDYKFAYKYLDETFKEENYKTQADFEQYMSSKYPSRYNASVSNIEKDGNVYSAEVELNIPDEDFSDKYMTVIMRLDEGTNFTMSFSEE